MSPTIDLQPMEESTSWDKLQVQIRCDVLRLRLCWFWQWLHPALLPQPRPLCCRIPRVQNCHMAERCRKSQFSIVFSHVMNLELRPQSCAVSRTAHIATIKSFNMFQSCLYFRTWRDTNIERARDCKRDCKRKRFIKTNPETQLDLTVKPAFAVAPSNSK